MKRLSTTMMISLLFNMNIMAKEQVDITLLSTSDLHGVFIPWDYASDQANTKGSLSQIATKIREIRAETRNVLLIDTGDLIQGNAIETFKEDDQSPMIMGLNALNYDIWVMGNHEFDFGPEVLQRSLNQFRGTALTANIYRDDGTHFLDPYRIMEFDGVKIGLIAVTTPMVVEFAKGSDRLKGRTFTNPSDEVKKTIAEIKDQVDALILISHMGLTNENDVPDTGNIDIANKNPELAAIFAGHMHVNLEGETVNGVLITEPGKYGETLARIDLSFKKTATGYQLTKKQNRLYPIAGTDSDPQMEQLFAPYHKILQENANKPVARLSGSNLVPQTKVKGIPQIHIQDTGISALFHEACMYFSPKTNVIALSIDTDSPRLDTGDIRVKDIAYNYPYKGGEITVYKLTGKELKAYMEWSAAYFNQVQTGDVTYSFNPERRASKYSTNDFFGNVTYQIDLSEPAGQRIKGLSFADGTKITDNTPIHLGMNAYRMGHLTQKGGVLEGQSFPILFDSKAFYGDEEGTVRNLVLRYLVDVKKGRYEGKVSNRWQITGLQGYEPQRVIIESLLNRGEITVPTSPDGQFTNIASINVKNKHFTNKADYQARLNVLEKLSSETHNEADKRRIEDDIIIIKALNSF